jgi:hypothetical protein
MFGSPAASMGGATKNGLTRHSPVGQCHARRRQKMNRSVKRKESLLIPNPRLLSVRLPRRCLVLLPLRWRLQLPPVLRRLATGGATKNGLTRHSPVGQCHARRRQKMNRSVKRISSTGTPLLTLYRPVHLLAAAGMTLPDRRVARQSNQTSARESDGKKARVGDEQRPAVTAATAHASRTASCRFDGAYSYRRFFALASAAREPRSLRFTDRFIFRKEGEGWG